MSLASPAFSAEELAYQLDDGGATAIVTTAEHLPTALAAAKKVGIEENRVILIGARNSKYQHFSQFRKSVDSSPIQKKKYNPNTTLAFLVYSSGTTGLSKGNTSNTVVSTYSNNDLTRRRRHAQSSKYRRRIFNGYRWNMTDILQLATGQISRCLTFLSHIRYAKSIPKSEVKHANAV